LGVQPDGYTLTPNSAGLLYMRRSRGFAALALLLTVMTVGTCAYPTERDSSVHVSITPVRILFSGHDTVVAARAWEVSATCPSTPGV